MIQSNDTNQHTTPSTLLNTSIFIIDDDSLMIDFISQLLQAAGWSQKNVHGFTQSTEAMDLMRFVNPDLVLTDIHMPNLSGDFMAKMLQWPQFEKTPIIVVTGDESFQFDQSKAIQGIVHVLHKPVDSMTLLSCIKSTLEESLRAKQFRKGAETKENSENQQRIRQQETDLRELFGHRTAKSKRKTRR